MPALVAIGPACSVEHHRHYTNCDDGMMTGLGNRIKMNGYYSYKTTYKHNKPSPSAGTLAMQQYEQSVDYNVYYAVVFYEDGSECSSYSYSSLADAAAAIKYEAAENRYRVSWGRYRISGDTIKVQFEQGKDYANTVIAENWYRINKDVTINYVAGLCRPNRNSREYYNRKGFSRYIPQPDPCTFTPLAAKPDSMLSNLRGKKWYKCK